MWPIASSLVAVKICTEMINRNMDLGGLKVSAVNMNNLGYIFLQNRKEESDKVVSYSLHLISLFIEMIIRNIKELDSMKVDGVNKE